MRQELLAHLVEVFDEELQITGDEKAALVATQKRFGQPSEIREELQSVVPGWRSVFRTIAIGVLGLVALPFLLADVSARTRLVTSTQESRIRAFFYLALFPWYYRMTWELKLRAVELGWVRHQVASAGAIVISLVLVACGIYLARQKAMQMHVDAEWANLAID
jgi:hypothetical protein